MIKDDGYEGTWDEATGPRRQDILVHSYKEMRSMTKLRMAVLAATELNECLLKTCQDCYL
jgi:hypothetical protein